MAWGLHAQAGGLDRTGQDLGPLFESGRYLSMDAFATHPDIEGLDGLGQSTGQVAENYRQWGIAYKQDLGPRSSAMLMLNKPFGLDIGYGAQHSSLFGGTQVRVSSHELTGALRYRFDERWAGHGGLRLQRTEGHVALGGRAFGRLSGYRADFQPSTEAGYLLGLSYERPDMALRVAGTYYSSVKHKVATRENLQPALETRTNSSSPESFNLDMQTGITPRTLLFGQIRWARWSQFRLSPHFLAAVTQGLSVADMEDTTSYTLGLGQKLSEHWSGFAALSYEKSSDRASVSPLRPTNGRRGYTVGVSYQQGQFKLTPWLSYQQLGSAHIASSGIPLATFKDESAMAFGIKLGYQF